MQVRLMKTFSLRALLLLAATISPGLLYGGDGKTDTAIFAGGCFWCMVAPYANLPGVVSVTSGYTGGHLPHPSYEQVSSGTTGHAESIKVVYDPAKLSYAKLLDIYWHNIDPTTPKRQFCDSGDQYRTAIFYENEEQKRAALASREALAASGDLKAPIVTEIVAATEFYPAEEYHQDYYRKRDIEYQIYRHACGRDRRLQELYGSAAKTADH
jgi:peptide-methionine (S)-S-oxide reductase